MLFQVTRICSSASTEKKFGRPWVVLTNWVLRLALLPMRSSLCMAVQRRLPHVVAEAFDLWIVQAAVLADYLQ